MAREHREVPAFRVGPWRRCTEPAEADPVAENGEAHAGDEEEAQQGKKHISEGSTQRVRNAVSAAVNGRIQTDFRDVDAWDAYTSRV